MRRLLQRCLWYGRVAIVLTASLFPASAAAQSTRPNVVYFLVDNLGMGELSAYSGVRCGVLPPSASTISPRKV